MEPTLCRPLIGDYKNSEDDSRYLKKARLEMNCSAFYCFAYVYILTEMIGLGSQNHYHQKRDRFFNILFVIKNFVANYNNPPPLAHVVDSGLKKIGLFHPQFSYISDITYSFFICKVS